MVVRHNEDARQLWIGLLVRWLLTGMPIFYGNVIYDNYRWGIFWELSYGGARIHDNVLTGNGVGDGSLNCHNAQLVVANSDGSAGGIEIYDNVITGSHMR